MAAAHAVQTGVATMMNFNSDNSTEPKHLRTGIDLGKSDMEGLARLLIEKGVFDEEEYYTALADAAEREKARYEKTIELTSGAKIVLG